METLLFNWRLATREAKVEVDYFSIIIIIIFLLLLLLLWWCYNYLYVLLTKLKLECAGRQFVLSLSPFPALVRVRAAEDKYERKSS